MTDSSPAPLVRFTGLRLSSAGIRALQRGDRRGLVAAVMSDLGGGDGELSDHARAALETLSELALELRRQSVAVLGSHEAFVRHTDSGSLSQVIRPVRLSVGDGTLFQIRARRPVCTEQGHSCFNQAINTKGHSGSYEWRDITLGDPTKAVVTYPGYLRMNAVAGCAVGMPPRVWVDGEERTNPYVEREGSEVIRIVVTTTCVGPTPVTGNPVVVNYTLDYDPRKDLAHMLLRERESAKEDITMVRTALLKDDDPFGRLAIAAGISVRFSLELDVVFEVMKTYTELQANALKKALTVARRNAMKAHPALGVQAVQINSDGIATVAVTGWSGDKAAVRQWGRIQDALSRGMPLPEADEVEVLVLEETYDANRDGQGLGDAELRHSAETEVATGDEHMTEEARDRASAIAYIDRGVLLLSPDEVASLAYDPAANSLAELVIIRSKLDAFLDAST